MGSPPLKPTDAQDQSAHDAAPYQASIQQQADSGPFWVRTFGDPIASFTLILAVTTICLLIANILLWLTNRKIVGFMGRQTTVAEKQATLFEKQLAIQGMQTDVLEKQKEISRIQFLAEHRPKLVLKDVYFSGASDFGEISFEIANAGGVTALVAGGFIALDFVNDPREFKDFAERSLEPLDKHTGFLPGDVRPFAIRTSYQAQQRLITMKHALADETLQIATEWAEEPTWPETPFYFFGVIYYTDERGEEFGVRYATVFRRRWNPETGSFERTGNPDHEYAD
jgi:hypothetical protein